jgi:hypothetical protein
MKTTIQIAEKTKEYLQSMGKKGETYDTIINKLLQCVSREKYDQAGY